jgi:hypothetical protein
MGDIADQFRASTRVEALTRVTTVADAETLLRAGHHRRGDARIADGLCLGLFRHRKQVARAVVVGRFERLVTMAGRRAARRADGIADSCLPERQGSENIAQSPHITQP